MSGPGSVNGTVNGLNNGVAWTGGQARPQAAGSTVAGNEMASVVEFRGNQMRNGEHTITFLYRDEANVRRQVEYVGTIDIGAGTFTPTHRIDAGVDDRNNAYRNRVPLSGSIPTFTVWQDAREDKNLLGQVLGTTVTHWHMDRTLSYQQHQQLRNAEPTRPQQRSSLDSGIQVASIDEASLGELARPMFSTPPVPRTPGGRGAT